MTFKEAIERVLIEEGKPLHFREITRIALKKEWLRTEGRTPHATVNAQIAVDIKTRGKRSKFRRVATGVFALRTWKEYPEDVVTSDWPISQALSSKQKGDIAEARIAELIQLYGQESLSCYKPISDDEGIDLIIKRKGASLQSHYIQIKSRFKLTSATTFLQTPSRDFIIDSYHMSLIFVYFDLSLGDIAEYLWFIPAPDFIDKAPLIPANPAKGRKARFRFNASIKNPTSGKWSEYAINKRALADGIVVLMDKVR